MSTVLVQPPDTEGLRSEALTLVDRAKSITIRNNGEHDLAFTYTLPLGRGLS